MKSSKKIDTNTTNNHSTAIMGYVVLDMLSLVPRQENNSLSRKSAPSLQAINKSRIKWEKLARNNNQPSD